MRFLSIETAVCEIGVESAVGLAELRDPASKVESVALLLVWVATVIVVFPLLLLPIESCLNPNQDVIGKDHSRFVKACQSRPPKTFTAH
jgi:hypothetical protein